MQRSARSHPGPAGTARSWGREPAAQTSPHKAEAPSFPNDPGTFVRQEVTYTCLGPVCVSRRAAAHVRAHHVGRPLVCPEVTPATLQGDSWTRRPLQPGPRVSVGPLDWPQGPASWGPGHSQPGPGPTPFCLHSPLVAERPPTLRVLTTPHGARARSSQLLGRDPDASPREGTEHGGPPAQGRAGDALVGFGPFCGGVSTRVHIQTRTHTCGGLGSAPLASRFHRGRRTAQHQLVRQRTDSAGRVGGGEPGGITP